MTMVMLTPQRLKTRGQKHLFLICQRYEENQLQHNKIGYKNIKINKKFETFSKSKNY